MAEINDEQSFHLENLEPPPDVARVDLIARLKEAEEAAKHPGKPPPPPVDSPPPATPVAAGGGLKPWMIVLAVLIVLSAAGGGGWYLWNQREPQPEATEELTPTPKATKRPTPRPSVRPSATPRPVPPPPAPPAATYTVQPGDTLITIGDKLRKDWRAIAAANGNIQDPNLIYPGQVLKIP